MYKIDIGKALTKYFLSYSEASQYAKATGINVKRIKSVH